MAKWQKQPDVKTAVRGGIVGSAAALVAFGSVGVALASQAGVSESRSAETSAAPTQSTSTQPGVSAARNQDVATTKSSQEAPSRPVTREPRRSSKSTTPARQAGITETAKPAKNEDKGEAGDEVHDEGERESVEDSQPAPAPVQQPTPVQQAPAPAPTPVQQAPAPAPAPVQQTPAPAPAPVPQQAPAPEPGITIDLGGRGEVVPQAPIAPTELRIG